MKRKFASALLALTLLLLCLAPGALADSTATPTTPAQTTPAGETPPETTPVPDPETNVELEIGKLLTGEDSITFTYGTKKKLTLDFTNVGSADALSMKVTPIVSNDVSSFPFKITKAYWEEPMVNAVPADKLAAASVASDTLTAQEKGMNTGLVSFEFDVRSDAPSGYYPLRLTVSYLENGKPVTVEALLYVKVVNKSLNSNDNPTVPVSPGGDTPQSTPRLIVSGFKTTPEKVMAGEPFTLELTLTNTSDKVAVSNMKIIVASAEEGVFLPVSGSSTTFIRKIAAGESDTVTMEMNTKADLTPKSYALSVKIDYEGKSATQYTSEESVSVPVHQVARLTLSDISLVPEAANVGDSVNLMVNLYNMGKAKLSNVLVKLESDGLVAGEDYFAGNMDPGATSMMDVMITPTAAGELPCRLVVSYEDEMGQSYTEEKEFSFFASEYVVDPGVIEPDPDIGVDGKDPVNTGFSKLWMILGGVLVVVVAGIIVLIVLLRRRRRKHIRHNMDHYLDNFDDSDGTSGTDSHDDPLS